MTVTEQFLALLLGSFLGVGTNLLFLKRSREHAIASCFFALGLACAAPVWRWTLQGRYDDLLTFVAVLVVTGCAGMAVGLLIERRLRKKTNK